MPKYNSKMECVIAFKSGYAEKSVVQNRGAEGIYSMVRTTVEETEERGPMKQVIRYKNET